MQTYIEKTITITPEQLIHAYIKEPNAKNFMPLYRYIKSGFTNAKLISDTLAKVVSLSPAEQSAKNMILYTGFILTITTEHSTVAQEQYVINQICNSGTPTGTNSDIHWFLLGQLLSKSPHSDALTLPNNWGTIKRPYHCYNQALWKNPSLIVAIEEQKQFINNFISKINKLDPKIKASELINQTKGDFEALKDVIQNAKDLHQILSQIPKMMNRLSFLTHLIGTTETINNFRHAEKPVDQPFIHKVFKDKNDLTYVLSTLSQGGETLKPREVILKRLKFAMPKWMNSLPEGSKVTPSNTQPVHFSRVPRVFALVPTIRTQPFVPSVEGGEIEDLSEFVPVPAPIVTVENPLNKGLGQEHNVVQQLANMPSNSKNIIEIIDNEKMDLETPIPENLIDDTEEELVPFLATVVPNANAAPAHLAAVPMRKLTVTNTPSNSQILIDLAECEEMETDKTEIKKSSQKHRPTFFNKVMVNISLENSQEELPSLKRSRDTDEDQNPRVNKKR